MRPDDHADQQVTEDRRQPDERQMTTTTTAAPSRTRISCSVCGIGRARGRPLRSALEEDDRM
jgi:hypothetical protein